jgi:hypothetical protein
MVSAVLSSIRFLSRRTWDIKPILACGIFLTVVFTVPASFFWPMLLAKENETLAKVLLCAFCLPAFCLAGYYGVFSLLAPKFSSRLGFGGLLAGLVIAAGFSMVVYRHDRAAELKQVFLQERAPVPLSFGKPISPLELADEMRALESEVLKRSPAAQSSQ